MLSGSFVHSILQKHPDSQPPIILPPSGGGEPTEMPSPTSRPSPVYPQPYPPTQGPVVFPPVIDLDGGDSAINYMQWQQQVKKYIHVI